MKITTQLLALVGILTTASQGAVTITGTIGSQFKVNGGASNIGTGSLVLLIADTGLAGFLADSGPAITASTSALTGPRTISLSNAGLTVGSTFGGDTVMATSAAGGSGSISGFAGFTATTGTRFAIVWFSQAAASVGASSYFGMMSLSDWLMPNDADGKTYSLNTSDSGGAAGFYSTSVATSSTQLGANGFVTGSGSSTGTSNVVKSATFQIIPEPSAALLGALGALGLLRRRRN